MSLIRYNCFTNYLRVNVYITDINTYNIFYKELKNILYSNYQIKSITTYKILENNYCHYIIARNIFDTSILNRHFKKLFKKYLISISCLTKNEYNKDMKKYELV